MSRARFDPFGSSPLVWGGLLLVIVGGLLGGCSSFSFLGRQYTNITAYYNKFYNAEKAFQKGLKSMERGDQPVDRTKYISVFRSPMQGGDGSSFEKAIQKSADVLREHPDSKWVDDALLLIGKSYFYQQNYVGAAQKFRETIALEQERVREARFWLARTLVATRRYDEAEKVLRAGLQEAGLGPWTARLYLVRGELRVRREQWTAAAQALNKGLQGDVPDEVGARAAFLLGQVQETMERPAAARTAYQQVREYDPRYALDFAARLSDVELQGMHGKMSRALDRLRSLERDEKNYERRGEMAVVRARIYRAQGRYKQARRTLKAMLYGEETPSGASKGRLHYDLARLYRDAYKDFSQAAAHFDTASTSLGTRSGQAGEEEEEERLPSAPVDPGGQADRYRDLAKRSRKVARLDSLLRVGRMSDSEFQAFVQKLRQQRREEREAQRRKRKRAQRSRQFQGQGRAVAKRRQGADPAAKTRQSDAGFLFYDDPTRVQKGRRRFKKTWGDRPRVDNWRRRTAIRTSGTASSGGGENTQQKKGASSSTASADGQGTSKPTAPLDLSAIPRDSASQAEMEAERAVARYKLANSLFLAAGRPDSAATWYRRILQENGDHPVAKRALYALAESYRAQGDTLAARQSYRRLVEQYPDTDLAGRARRRLGEEKTPADDRSALANAAYTRAYEVWQQGKLSTAFPELLNVASRYPDTEAAPRALLAAGIVYWKQLQKDTITVARSVLEKHLQAFRPSGSSSAQNASASDSAAAAARTIPSDSVGADSTLADSVEENTAPVDSANVDSAVVEKKSTKTDSTRSGEAEVGSTQSPTGGVDSTRTQESGPKDTLRTASADSIEGTGRGAQPDSAASRVSADTTASVERTAAAEKQKSAADSTRQKGETQEETDGYGPLKSLLTYLTEQYSDAPQVTRARVMLKMIEERRSGPDSVQTDTTTQTSPAADTTTTVPQTVAETREGKQQNQQARSDRRSTQASRASDTTRSTSSASQANRSNESEQNRQNQTNQSPLPAPTNVQSQDEGAAQRSIDRSRGGWTLLVQTFANSQGASTRVAEVGRRLGDRWVVDLLKEGQEGQTQYRLVVGQFQSKRAAAQAQKRVADRLSRRPEVWSLSEAKARP